MVALLHVTCIIMFKYFLTVKLEPFLSREGLTLPPSQSNRMWWPHLLPHSQRHPINLLRRTAAQSSCQRADSREQTLLTSSWEIRWTPSIPIAPRDGKRHSTSSFYCSSCHPAPRPSPPSLLFKHTRFTPIAWGREAGIEFSSCTTRTQGNC